MKGNPFLGIKFLYAGEKYVKTLLTKDWHNLPPISAEIDPTNLCNEKCVWCMFSEYRQRKPVSISLKDMKRVIHQLSEIGCKSVTFTGGGEALCNPEVFPEAFYEVVNHGMKCALITNGVNIDKYLKAIAETCVYIRASVDAGTSETYRRLHGLDAWSKVWNNLSALHRFNPSMDIGVAFLVHPENHKEVEDFYNMAMLHGLSYAEIRPVLLPGFSLSKKIIDSAISQTRNFKEEHAFPVFARMGRFIELIEGERGFTKCRGTPLLAVIGADLNVYPCCTLRGIEKFAFGNLKEASFTQIWSGENRKKTMEKMDINQCTPCRLRQYNITLEQLTEATHVEFL